MNSEDFFNQWVMLKFGVTAKLFRRRVGDKLVDELEKAFFAGFEAGREMEGLLAHSRTDSRG